MAPCEPEALELPVATTCDSPPLPAALRTWHIVTGEYPPDRGGVADYTASVAAVLAERGVDVHVWSAGAEVGSDEVVGPEGVTVHRLAGCFGPGGLARLDRALDRFPGPRTILIQYVPQLFGWKAMNVAFALWAWGRRLSRRDDVRVMFHEVAFPWVRRPLRRNGIALVNRVMAAILIRACTRAYVSIPGWVPTLRRLGAGRLPLVWTPVPSGVPAGAAAASVATRRAELTRNDSTARLVCHFGTYGSPITGDLRPVLCELLDRRPDVRVLLLGCGGERWRAELVDGRPDWCSRITAPGALPAPVIAEYLRACDLVIQPYPDGASGRRTSLMAALANGLPVVTTTGALSEPLWANGAVAAASAGDRAAIVRLALELLDSPESRAALGAAGLRLYQDQFALHHTITTILETP
jgi:glycosyltransferase involved in cell wall biosynthesis